MEDQFLSMLAYVADQERQKNRQRQAEGIEAAKSQGIKFGRPKMEITNEFLLSYEQWKTGNITAVEVMKRLDMTKSTFYRIVKEFELKK